MQVPGTNKCGGEADRQTLSAGDVRTVRRRTERQNCLSVLHSADVARTVP